MLSSQPSSTCAVIVTWNPDLKRLESVLRVLAPQCGRTVVVDNGSRSAESVSSLLSQYDNTTFIGLSENFGIATALNIAVTNALRTNPTWILTLDQDTVLAEGAIEFMLKEFSHLHADNVERYGILAMRSAPQPSSISITRYADRLMVIRELPQFVERRGVINSGSLIRCDVATAIRFNEQLFIDQVDFDFCFSVRQRGYQILQHRAITMDHLLGGRHPDSKRDHPYENAQRLYYMVRNSTYLVLRRRLPLRFYVVQIVVFSGAFISINGVPAILTSLRVLVTGVVDGLLSRLGRREYSFLKQGKP